MEARTAGPGPATSDPASVPLGHPPHEFALLLPSLSEDEFAALTESIREYGVINPITVDDAGLILDGVHRDRICATLGIDCPVNQVGPMPDEKKLRLAFGLNFRQRTLDVDRRRALVAKLSTGKGMSIRQIAHATGWSKSQVQRDLQPLPQPVQPGSGRFLELVAEGRELISSCAAASLAEMHARINMAVALAAETRYARSGRLRRGRCRRAPGAGGRPPGD